MVNMLIFGAGVALGAHIFLSLSFFLLFYLFFFIYFYFNDSEVLIPKCQPTKKYNIAWKDYTRKYIFLSY
jgi:hypothetical protein